MEEQGAMFAQLPLKTSKLNGVHLWGSLTKMDQKGENKTSKGQTSGKVTLSKKRGTKVWAATEGSGQPGFQLTKSCAVSLSHPLLPFFSTPTERMHYQFLLRALENSPHMSPL